MLTCKQAAEKLGVTKQQVSLYIKAGQLPALRFGDRWIILEEELRHVKDLKPGRPKKKNRKRKTLYTYEKLRNIQQAPVIGSISRKEAREAAKKIKETK